MATESSYSNNKLLEVLNDQHFATINTYYDCPHDAGEKREKTGS